MTTMDADLDALAQWLESEIRASELTLSAFAQKMELHHSVLSRIMKQERQPELKTLHKLAVGTHTSLSVLVALTFPKYEYGSGPSARALILAQQLDDFPGDVQQKIIEIALSTMPRK